MKILAVCLGNICRSPLAEGILRTLSAKAGLHWEIDSAGTSDWHSGENPCEGSVGVARKNGIDISRYRARKITPGDISHYDLILAMDSSNYQDILSMTQNPSDRQKIHLILNYSFPGQNRSVPDSYFTGNYEEVFNLLWDACAKIIDEYNGHS